MSLCSFGKPKNAVYILEGMEYLLTLKSNVSKLQAYIALTGRDCEKVTDGIIVIEIEKLEGILKKITKLWTYIPTYLATLIDEGTILKDEWKAFLKLEIIDDDDINKITQLTDRFHNETIPITFKSFKDYIKQKV